MNNAAATKIMVAVMVVASTATATNRFAPRVT
jgi:hypothetical protein